MCVRSSTSSDDEEGIVQRARRVIGGCVERLEVVVVGLDLGTLGDLVAHADEDVLDLAARRSDQVQVAQRERTTRQRDVDAVAFERPDQFVGLELRQPRLERRLEFSLDKVAELADDRSFVGGELGDASQQDGQLGLAAQEAHSDVLERRRIDRAVDRAHARGVDTS